jgi:thioredoxin-related protein
MALRKIQTLKAIFLIALCAHFLPAIGQNGSKAHLLAWPADIAKAAAQANARGEPLVLMVSLPGCPWCELLRRNYLLPMSNEGVTAYEFMINERSRTLQDFKNQKVTPAALATALKVTNTPTVLFFNAKGEEIAPRIEGVASADFIGAVLDERLATARERLKTR